jgi:hypothetical protein
MIQPNQLSTPDVMLLVTYDLLAAECNLTVARLILCTSLDQIGESDFFSSEKEQSGDAATVLISRTIELFSKYIATIECILQTESILSCYQHARRGP